MRVFTVSRTLKSLCLFHVFKKIIKVSRLFDGFFFIKTFLRGSLISPHSCKFVYSNRVNYLEVNILVH